MILLRRLAFGILALAMLACSTQSAGGSLQTGMTPDQSVAAMGQPDLRDNVPDPNHSGANLLRYTWLNAGKSATFGSDNHLASIQDIGPAPATVQEAEQEQQAAKATEFDPINTPLNYAFYPFRVAFIYLGAGLNCVGGGGCQKPHLPPVNQG
jgi:hypothetical protein